MLRIAPHHLRESPESPRVTPIGRAIAASVALQLRMRIMRNLSRQERECDSVDTVSPRDS